MSTVMRSPVVPTRSEARLRLLAQRLHVLRAEIDVILAELAAEQLRSNYGLDSIAAPAEATPTDMPAPSSVSPDAVAPTDGAAAHAASAAAAEPQAAVAASGAPAAQPAPAPAAEPINVRNARAGAGPYSEPVPPAASARSAEPATTQAEPPVGGARANAPAGAGASAESTKPAPSAPADSTPRSRANSTDDDEAAATDDDPLAFGLRMQKRIPPIEAEFDELPAWTKIKPPPIPTAILLRPVEAAGVTSPDVIDIVVETASRQSRAAAHNAQVQSRRPAWRLAARFAASVLLLLTLAVMLLVAGGLLAEIGTDMNARLAPATKAIGDPVLPASHFGEIGYEGDQGPLHEPPARGAGAESASNGR